jgi:hypothetical protein
MLGLSGFGFGAASLQVGEAEANAAKPSGPSPMTSIKKRS